MSKALAIETSGRVGSVAILENGVVVGEDEFPHGLQNAAMMIPRIDALCRSEGWEPGEFEEIYVSVGPGSFTGLRIGVTLAKTLAMVMGARVVAVPSVWVLARNAPAEARNLIIVLDAKRRQIFTARFEREAVGQGGWMEREGAHLDELKAMVERSPKPVWLLGEGIGYHREAILGMEAVIETTGELWQPRARETAQVGMEMGRRGEFVEADALTPLYIRKPEAEEVWERKQRRSTEPPPLPSPRVPGAGK
jgi:tRNA threonylcarbamoyladenosine biosynthesis protein TsaB